MNDDETVDDVDREATAHVQTQDVRLPRRTFSTTRRNIHVSQQELSTPILRPLENVMTVLLCNKS